MDIGKQSGNRLRKKRKSLDSICEEEYKKYHGESNEGNEGSGSVAVDLEPRRSTRQRRAPVILDVSPSPSKRKCTVDKKRSSLHKSGDSSLRRVKEESEKSEDSDTPESWKSRLRRRRNVGLRVEDDVGASTRRIKQFEYTGATQKIEERVASKMDDKMGFDALNSRVVKSKRSKRKRRLSCSLVEVMTNGCLTEKVITMGNENGTIGEKVLSTENKSEENVRSDMDIRNKAAEEEEMEVLNSKSQEALIRSHNVEEMEHGNNHIELDCMVEKQSDIVLDEAEPSVGDHDGKSQNLKKPNDEPVEDIVSVKLDASKHMSTNTLSKRSSKQGRRCGLCGRGTDGRPLKKFVQDIGESDTEVYGGSSASEEPNYDIWDGFSNEPGWLGRLLGPVNDRYGIAGIWVHQLCAVWSPEVYFAGVGCLKKVRAALCRGRALKCTCCGRPGATIGCRVDKCQRTYHLPCARAEGCIFDHRKFLIACTYHRRLFQPQGNQYIARIKKMKAKKMKMEIRKLSNEAMRKDAEAEEKWLENCGDDEEFMKRESKRLHRDLSRIAPVYIGGSNSEGGTPYQGWESVAGLQDVIQCMKEVVILPLLYPEFFDNLGLTPPRGVLLHGYPGTGKTLLVRALIGSLSHGNKRIAYFARKGADCLGKYVGDAERQLRLLFQVAEKCQPSVIFFDEIDGLAPRRTRQQDQTHSSVVSTLLALMDGLKSRGSVVVIGATNRPDALDPALRRPGRFDREVHFPLPSTEDRSAILTLHTKSWPKPLGGSLLKWIATKTVGFAGADLQALCTQAAIVALKRNFPLQVVLSAAQQKIPGAKRVPLPEFSVEERDWLETLSCAQPPCSHREAGIATNDVASSSLQVYLVPCLLQSLSTLFVSFLLEERLWLPPTLFRACTVFKSVIVSVLNSKRLPANCWWSYVDDFLQEEDIAMAITRRLSMAGIFDGEICLNDGDAIADGSIDPCAKFEPPKVHNVGTLSGRLGNVSFMSGKKSGFRILIAGSPRSGQRHLASFLLHCFLGNVEVQKVDVATISQEGRGDLVQGITQILMKCASKGTCVVFMPRIDLWAMEVIQSEKESVSTLTDSQICKKEKSCLIHDQVVEEQYGPPSMEQCEEDEPAEITNSELSVSVAWSSFVEQVESICVSTSLIIMATSGVPYEALPDKIRHFFKSDLSNCRLSAPFQSVPRFAVQVGENFHREIAINLSAASLSRKIIQPFVYSIHQRTHTCKVYKSYSSIQNDTDTVCQSSGHGSATAVEDRSEFLNDLSKKDLPRPSPRNPEGKSDLLLAISTFGFQILRYPHFAELCWVTSKLKEGPSADVHGPWKGWPFNSCIIRPGTSAEKVAVPCDSSNDKSKEKFGIARGLIAVGLSAYRGKYTSLLEVSFEVRKVLELLVDQINTKVSAGKDKYQYIRLLSQVAYLEDIVNNWVYALQSLKLDIQLEGGNSKLSAKDSSGLFPIKDGNPSISEGSCRDPKGLEENPEGAAKQSVDSVNSDKANFTTSKEAAATRSKECSALQIDLNKNNTNRNLTPCELENLESLATDTQPNPVKHSNGFIKFVGLSEINLSNSAEPNADVHPSPVEQTDDMNLSPSKTKIKATASDGACFYHCCSECMITLQNLIRKLLVHERGLNRNDWKAEDLHEAVDSLSVDLLSDIKKLSLTRNGSSTKEENIRHETGEASTYHHCRCSADSFECCCHSVDDSATKANGFQDAQFRSDLNFVFRDGVLVPVDSNKDLSFHCKSESLCLCPLIESIVTRKQLFD